MKKNSIKRAQSQAGLSFAERLRVGEPCSGMREKFRPQVKNILLLLLVLLMTAATGAWAQTTTHVVKQKNVNTIFSGDGYTLGDAVKAGDVLDFQGTIELDGDASHSLVINKQVSIISSTKDAVINLHTQLGSLLGDDPGNSFVINAAGAGTTVQDIRLENTEMWIFNTSTLDFMNQGGMGGMQMPGFKVRTLKADDYPTWAQRRRALFRLLVEIGKEPDPEFPQMGGFGGGFGDGF